MIVLGLTALEQPEDGSVESKEFKYVRLPRLSIQNR